ncbi:hypothetical protein CP970_38505 [Streptomyces kanamyceticus]|uniref:Uncharacterized protein n=1 Tax=Streptomyces kanamyceticus TaxID=1967 RepID=A0A5J6GPK2_STRKN|nr:hypothetical protein CP970_38505 [Streptomyces kanamyceticus]
MLTGCSLHDAGMRLTCVTRQASTGTTRQCRETYDRWTNVWWAKTDDDSGNRNVFVSDVHFTGGDQDKPLPGLPTC